MLDTTPNGSDDSGVDAGHGFKRCGGAIRGGFDGSNHRAAGETGAYSSTCYISRQIDAETVREDCDVDADSYGTSDLFDRAKEAVGETQVSGSIDETISNEADKFEPASEEAGDGCELEEGQIESSNNPIRNTYRHRRCFCVRVSAAHCSEEGRQSRAGEDELPFDMPQRLEKRTDDNLANGECETRGTRHPSDDGIFGRVERGNLDGPNDCHTEISHLTDCGDDSDGDVASVLEELCG